MPSPSIAAGHLRRLIALLGALVLLPLAALLGAAPAHADTANVSGQVVDGLGDRLAGVTVDALTAPAYTTVAGTTATDSEGSYVLAVPDGTYRLRYSKAGYDTAFYGGEDGVDVVVSGGVVSVDGEPVESNDLDEITLFGSAVHEVTGTLENDSHEALPGITVEAFLSGDDETPVGVDTTNGSGAYTLGLRSGVYTIRYTDPGDTYLTTWYDGTSPEPVDVVVTGPQALATVTLQVPAPDSRFPIAGLVVDANGDAVDGVLVSVDPVGASTDSGTDTTQPVGDDHGTYAVSVLPGTYQVSYAKTGFVATKYGGLAPPSTVTVGNTGTLSVTPAETLLGNRLADVTLESTPYAVSGIVETTGGVGIAGITVRAFPEDSTDPLEVVDTDTSNGSGGYTLDLPVGSYDLHFTDGDDTGPTYVSGSLTGVTVSQGGALSVGDTPVDGLPNVQLAVSSADTAHPVVGSVVDATGTEVDGLDVTAVPQGSGEQASDSTGADGGLGDHGRYRLLLKPGSYQIEIDGGSDWLGTTYVGDGTSTAMVQVQMNGTVLVNGVWAVGGELGSTEVAGKVKHTLGGTVTEGATALPGITVKAYAEDDLVTPVATTTSAGGGAWSLTGTAGLVVGSYAIEFSGSSGGSTYDRTYFGGTTPTPVVMTQSGVALVDGSTLDPANTLPAVSMTKSSLDTPHPVVGEVTDANGDPIVGVTVTPSGGPTTTTTSTAADGSYTLMLKPGTYQLGYTKLGFTAASYPTSVTVELDGTVTVGASPVSELEAITLEQTVGTTSISGRVMSGGSPVAGITVEVFNEGDLSAEGLARPAVTTAGNGTWTVTALKIGAYTVRFTDNVPAAPTYIQTYYGGAELATSTPVVVAQGDLVRVNDEPKAGGALGDTSMTVADANTTYAVTGSVEDANGDPIVGATVTPSGGPSTTPATTNADGEYTLDLKAGTYQVAYARTGFIGTSYPGSGEAPLSITIQSGGTMLVGSTPVSPRALDAVTLEQTTGATSISGRVMSGGSPVAGITVEVFNEGDLSAEGLARPAVTTAGNGTWTVTALKIGTYTVRFTDNVPAAPTYVQTTIGPVKVGQGTSNNVYLDDVLKPGGALGDATVTVADANTLHSIKGDVTDANFDPLPGVTVTAEPQSGTPAAAPVTTDDDGEYTLQVKAGTYKIKYSRAGFTTRYYLNDEDAQALVVVGLDGVVRILGEVVVANTLESVEMAGTTTYPLSGSVVDTSARPIAGIKVRAYRDGDTAVAAEATTAANGTFTIRLTVGTYTIAYVDTVPAAPTYVTGYYGGGTGKLVKVATGGAITDNDTEVAITGLGTVTLTEADANTKYDLKGLVYDEEYEPINGAKVRVLPVGKTADSAALYTGTTGPDAQADADAGYYRIPVKAGKYWLKYSAPGKATTYLVDYDTNQPVTVTVAANGAITAPGYEFVANQIDDVQLLLPARAFATNPKLSGKVAVGQVVTTSFGTLRGASIDKDYMTIEWFLDGKSADDYSAGNYSEKFKVPASAATRKLSYRVTIDDPDGMRAPSVFTSSPVAVPKAPATLKGAFKKGKLTVTLAVPTLPKPTGTVTVKAGKKKIATIKLKAKSKGKATVKLKLTPGKHKLTLSYAGSKTVSAATATVKVTVKK